MLVQIVVYEIIEMHTLFQHDSIHSKVQLHLVLDSDEMNHSLNFDGMILIVNVVGMLSSPMMTRRRINHCLDSKNEMFTLTATCSLFANVMTFGIVDVSRLPLA